MQYRATDWAGARRRTLARGHERNKSYANADGETVRDVLTRGGLDPLGDELDEREVDSAWLDDPVRAARELKPGPEGWEPTQSGV